MSIVTKLKVTLPEGVVNQLEHHDMHDFTSPEELFKYFKKIEIHQDDHIVDYRLSLDSNWQQKRFATAKEAYKFISAMHHSSSIGLGGKSIANAVENDEIDLYIKWLALTKAGTYGFVKLEKVVYKGGE